MLDRASSKVFAPDNSHERIFHWSSGVFSIDSIAGVHSHDCCETIDFVTLPTHSHVVCTPVLTHCTTFGATTSAHRTIAFPVAFATGLITLPLLETHPSASAGSATSQNPLACSCTAWFPPNNPAVQAEISHAFCHKYWNPFWTGSNHEAAPNNVLAIGIAPVATQNHACTAPFHACNTHCATSCHDWDDAIVQIPVPSCSAPPATIQGAETAIEPIPLSAFAPYHSAEVSPVTISLYSGYFSSIFCHNSSSLMSLYSGYFAFTILPNFAYHGLFATFCHHCEIHWAFCSYIFAVSCIAQVTFWAVCSYGERSLYTLDCVGSLIQIPVTLLALSKMDWKRFISFIL